MTNAEHVARRVLESFWDSSSGAERFPVDPVRIARSAGLNVYKTELDNNLSGMLAKLRPGVEPDIFLNSEHAPVRQRFTCAHELGHYFAIQGRGENPDTYIHRRDAVSSCGIDSEEIFANQFAAELLMPAAEVRRLRAVGADEFEMARRFNVSLDAIRIRISNVGVA
jgi:Zn-dependent peptidase ImmA (M78 family)